MNITINGQSAETNTCEAVVVPLSSLVADQALGRIDQASKGYIKALVKSGDIASKRGKCTTLFNVPNVKAKRVIIVGTGDKKSKAMNPANVESLYQAAKKELEHTGAKSAAFYLHEFESGDISFSDYIALGAKALLNANYHFDSQKSKKAAKPDLTKVVFSIEKGGAKLKNQAKAAVDRSKALSRGMSLCKDLANLPGNVCTPGYLAKEANKFAKSAKVTVKVIDEKSFERLGMGAFLSVAKGSDQPAKLIVINYQGGKKEDKPHVLVGKGITFDTGGISLKPGAAMDEMKFDMCGAASVMGTMESVIASKLKLNVIGVIAAAENMPSGGASKPGDIVKSMNGLTIEILNTDAEGRLVLCDALTYVERFKPASVIDIATLTGACVVALGNHATALYSNNEKLADRIDKAGKDSWDRVWPMPLWPEYNQQLHSRFADLANIGGPKAGSITAACFLSYFTKKYHWAHLDIAGTAWNGPGPNKGATGRPVPLLFEYLNKLAR